jgi:hypothetical protein
MARSSSSIAILPVLTATLVLFAKHAVAFNAPRVTQSVQFSTKGLRTHHNVEMAVQLRLPPMSSLPSPSSWMGGYLRAIDMHNGDLQMPTRRGTSLGGRFSFVCIIELIPEGERKRQIIQSDVESIKLLQ